MKKCLKWKTHMRLINQKTHTRGKTLGRFPNGYLIRFPTREAFG